MGFSVFSNDVRVCGAWFGVADLCVDIAASDKVGLVVGGDLLYELRKSVVEFGDFVFVGVGGWVIN